MANNKLMEAAADILANSKKAAPGMPPQKLPGEAQDLGGPTPQNGKPDDDSEKIDTGKGATKMAAPSTKPSAASSDTQLKPVGGKKTMSEEDISEVELTEEEYDQLGELLFNEDIQIDEGTMTHIELKPHPSKANATNVHYKSKHIGTITKSKSTGMSQDMSTGKIRKSTLGGHPGENKPTYSAKHKNGETSSGHGDVKNAVGELRDAHADKLADKRYTKMKIKEDIDSLFSDDDTISEEFKSKAATIFEARVYDRITQIEEETETRYAGMLEEAIDSIKADLTEKVDDYLNYVVEQWMSDNEIAIESGLRAELTEDFIGGLRNLFAEHYIDVPSEKVDLVSELAEKVEELEGKLNEEIERGISYAKALVESHKNEVTHQVCEGLTDTQAEKIKSLAEGVEFSTEDEYKEKLETIRENYFPSGVKKAAAQDLHEQVEDGSEKKTVTSDAYVQSVIGAISKTKL